MIELTQNNKETLPVKLFYATRERLIFNLAQGETGGTYKLSLRAQPDPNTVSMCDASGVEASGKLTFELNTFTQEFKRVCGEINSPESSRCWLEIYDTQASHVLLQRQIDIAYRAATLEGQPSSPVETYLKNPSGGTAGQVLKKTASGTEWADDSAPQSDWNQTDTTAADFIKNKPSVPVNLSELSEDSTHQTVTAEQKSTWNSKSDLLLGETASSAFPGNRGKALEDAMPNKAPLTSPVFTGIPTAPTAAKGTNTTQIATMAALKAGLDDKLSLSSGGTLGGRVLRYYTYQVYVGPDRDIKTISDALTYFEREILTARTNIYIFLDPGTYSGSTFNTYNCNLFIQRNSSATEPVIINSNLWFSGIGGINVRNLTFSNCTLTLSSGVNGSVSYCTFDNSNSSATCLVCGQNTCAANILGCTFVGNNSNIGVNCADNSFVSLGNCSISNCSIGIRAFCGSVARDYGASTTFSGCTADTSPAKNVVGNANSIVV